jgi:spore germination protein
MGGGLLQSLLFWLRGDEKKREPEKPSRSPSRGFPGDLDASLKAIKDGLGNSDDVVVREFLVGSSQEAKAAVLFIDGLVDKNLIHGQILRSVMLAARRIPPKDVPPGAGLMRLIKEATLPVSSVEETSELKKLLSAVMSGTVAFLIEGSDRVILVEAKGWEQRGVQEPETEGVIRGPRDGFTETLRVNTTLLRRRLRDSNLVIKQEKIGRRSETDIAVVYLRDVADPNLVEEVNTRLKSIDIDAVLETGYIEQFIEDSWLSPFPQMQSTERPDEVVAALLEGRVAIVVDNTPFVLLAPTTLNMLMHSPEDYYHRWLAASVIRAIRFLATFLAMTLPALYIALASYQPEMIPTKLALAIAAAREGVPFPVFLEAFIMEISIELLREAGTRLPGPIGQTIGIVGGIVIGDAAVRASIVSPVMVIVVAITAIGSFAVPKFDVAIALRLFRFLLMILATIFGLFGVVIGLWIILVHLATLKSFGISYLAPQAPTQIPEMRDTVLRAPWPMMHRRPSFMRPKKSDRLDDHRRDSTAVRDAEKGVKEG